jgi:hypothetical protein
VTRSATVTKRPEPAVMRKALLTERFGPISALVHERAESDALLTERFGPVAELVRERTVKVRLVKRPESAVPLSPAGSGLQPPKGSDDGPACAGRAPLWDFDAGEDANGCAKVVCITCPVRERCLAIGVRDKLSGVWGGISLLECGVCLDAEATRLQRRRELDRARKKASSA